MGVTTLVIGLQNWLYLKQELMEQTEFFHALVSLGKVKVTSIIFGCKKSKMGVANQVMGL